MPASSAPQRSQYHSVGRLSVPHSPHWSVFAPPAAPGFPGAAVWLAIPAPSADLAPDGPGLLPRRPEDGCGAGFRSSSGATDLRNAISSTGGPCVISASLGAGLGAGRVAAAATGAAGGGANRSGSGSGS